MKNSLVVHQHLKRWTVFDIVSAAYLISLWPILGLFVLPLRIILAEGQIPFFFFLIWFTGLTKKPYFAFVICFLGHLFFDLVFFFNPFFFFIWTASGLAGALIAWLKNCQKWLFLVAALLMPFLYISAFLLVGLIFFNYRFFWRYFVAFPQISIFLVFVNPVFNSFAYLVVRKNTVLQKMILLNRHNVPLSWIKTER